MTFKLFYFREVKNSVRVIIFIWGLNTPVSFPYIENKGVSLPMHGFLTKYNLKWLMRSNKILRFL